MRLAPFLIVRRRHRPFQRHVEIAQDAVAQVLEAMGCMVGVVIVSTSVDDELVVAVDGIIQLQGRLRVVSQVSRTGLWESPWLQSKMTYTM